MSTENPTGVQVERFCWGDRYTGDKASLLAHPACPAGIFDGEGTRWKNSRTIKPAGERRASIQRTGRRYALVLPLTDAEHEARVAAADAAQKVRQKLEIAQIQLEMFKHTAAEYKKEALSCVKIFGEFICGAAAGTFGTVRGGYSLDRDTLNTVGIHLQAIRTAFETGRVVFDDAARAAAEAAIMEKTRAADPAFGKMLGQITAGGEGRAG